MYFLVRPLLMCRVGGNQVASASSAESMTSEEITQAFATQPAAEMLDYDLVGAVLGTGNVGLIAPDAVAKFVAEIRPELSSMELVRRHTSIHVPRGIGLVDDLLVQQYIPGQRLSHAWATMSWWRRFRVLLTLRFYIRELRSLSSRIGDPAFPGPLCSHDHEQSPQLCKGRLFNESGGSGPFATYRELSRWYKNRLLVMQRFRNVDQNIAQFDDRSPLVFTHMDIHMDNIIVGDDGHLWIIDWADAGWYPKWFEAASMTIFARLRGSPWVDWISFVAGNCEKPGQLPFIHAISWSLNTLTSDIINLIDSDPRHN